MSEMIERVAIALSMADPDERGLPVGVEMPEFYRGLARAAIKAMRDPTDSMLDAGESAFSVPDAIGAGDAWQAMINAALAPAQPPGAEP